MNENTIGYQKAYFRIDEIARHFSVSCRTVYRMIEDEELPAVKIRGSLRIHKNDLAKYERWLKKNRRSLND